MKKFGHTIDDLKKIIPNWISFYNNRGINPQYRDKIKDSNIIIETTNKYDINGYFIGFTKECYSTYCLNNGSFFFRKVEMVFRQVVGDEMRAIRGREFGRRVRAQV